MRHALQQRHDYRLVANGRADRVDRAVEIVGLACQQDVVRGPADVLGQHRFHWDLEVALDALDPQTVRFELRLAAAPDQKRHIGRVALDEPAGEIAADGARTETQDSHGFTSKLRLPNAPAPLPQYGSLE